MNIRSSGQIQEGCYQTILYNEENMAEIKFSTTGFLLSCKTVEISKGDWETIDIVSNFSGQVFRIAYHNCASKEEEESKIGFE